LIPAGTGDEKIRAVTDAAGASALASYEALDFSHALEQIWSIIAAVDKYIVEQAPWKLAKNESAADQLNDVLYTAAEALRIVSALVSPALPFSAQKIWDQLGFSAPLSHTKTADLAWGGLKPNQSIGKVAGVFPRLDLKPTVEKMQELEVVEKNRQAALLGKAPEEPAAASAPQAAEQTNFISIDDFSKVDLRVGEVRSAEPVKGADKLLHLKVDIGEPEPRTIVAGIALAYKPEQLIGRKVVIVANLQPRKLRGLTSQGMIVAASLEGGLPVLAGFHEEIQPGARLK
jgi:methionyl-tRNA synthetase